MFKFLRNVLSMTGFALETFLVFGKMPEKIVKSLSWLSRDMPTINSLKQGLEFLFFLQHLPQWALSLKCFGQKKKKKKS